MMAVDVGEWKSKSMCICHDGCGCVNGNQRVCVFAMMDVDVGEWKSMCICHDRCGCW